MTTSGVRRRAVELSGAAGVPDGTLMAEWRFPESPLIPLDLGNQRLAVVDYSPASASAHWFLRWSDPLLASAHAEVAITTLAGQVPEDADTDEALRIAVLDAALLALISALGGTLSNPRPTDA